MYEIRTEQYAGPLEKLLELIEQRKMEVTTISLGNVTADFISYVKTLEDRAHPKIVADFILIASRLMLIKSKVLLPNLIFTPEEECEIKDLEERLRLYREFKEAGRMLAGFWPSSPRSFSRPFLNQLENMFCPPTALSDNSLFAAMRSLVGIFQILAPKEERTVKRILVSIEEKMGELMSRLSGNSETNFKAVVAGLRREEIVALFLAMLHLLKQQKIYIAQEAQFSDIIIKPNV
jgi:segregation and condensation protein A